jgi:pimeloyl-ACP methyl ester carboxylesterase
MMASGRALSTTLLTIASVPGLDQGQAPPPVPIPVGFTTFPGEIWRTPRSWVEKAYPNVVYFNEVDKGGHFAAWEEPELFSTEIRAAFRPVR